MKKIKTEKIENKLLKYLTEATGNTLPKLADELGIKYTTIYSYAKGVNQIPTELLKQIQDTYKFSDAKMWQFLTGVER